MALAAVFTENKGKKVAKLSYHTFFFFFLVIVLAFIFG